MRKYLTKFVLWYLRFFSSLQLKKIKPLIIGVGGSSGKSSTVSIIYQALKDAYKVKESHGKNSETGIPLNILDIDVRDYSYFSWVLVLFLAPLKLLSDWKRYDIYIVEMGIDSPYPPKNMDYLLKIIKPKIGILTDISIEHSQNFDALSKETNEQKRKQEILSLTSKEEALLIKSIEKDGYAVVNEDNEEIRKAISEVKAQVLSVSSKNPKSVFLIKEIRQEQNSFEVNFENKGKTYSIKIFRPLPKHYACAIVMGIAAASAAGLELEKGIESLSKNFTLPPGRATLFKGIKNTTIIDSSYNSSLEPAKDLLDLLLEVKGRRKVAVMGDMRELGSLSKAEHLELAEKIKDTADFAILIGPMLSEYGAPFLKKEGFNFKAFKNFSEAKSTIDEEIKEGDTILVKGSQNNLFLERAIEMLLADKEDVQKLCRRGSYWDKKRTMVQ